MRNEVYFTKSTKYSSQNPVLSRFVLFSLVMTFFLCMYKQPLDTKKVAKPPATVFFSSLYLISTITDSSVRTCK